MTDQIGYEALTQAAMRGVVRDVLRQTARDGAPLGDHHFYITFRTKAQGVKIADHLIERFPQDMTIVIQHQYWDLEVHEKHFEIILKFAGVPQHLYIPFASVTRFVDPSVNFGLSFEQTQAGDGELIAPVAISSDQDRNFAGSDEAEPAEKATGSAGTVVNIDAFRRK